MRATLKKMEQSTPFTLQLPLGWKVTRNAPDRADELIDFLNSLVKIDPYAMAELLCVKVPCNKALAEHPTVCVEPDGYATFIAPGTFRVNLLGLLNGFCADPNNPPSGWGVPIVPVYNDKTLSHFKRASEADVIVGLLNRAVVKTELSTRPEAPKDTDRYKP